MKQTVVTVKIVGPAGLGIKSMGQLLSKTLIKSGFNVYDYNEYPSLVRGGHNTYQVSFSQDKVYAVHSSVDMIFSISPGHWSQHEQELLENGLIFADEEPGNCENSKKGLLLKLPLKDMTTEIGQSMAANIICLGVASYMCQLDFSVVKEVLQSEFKKNNEINLKALKLGFEYAENNFSNKVLKIKKPGKKGELSHNYNDGNEAFGWGFIKGGGNFYAAYPMTPATGTLHFLAAKSKELGINVVHPEDEISAANMAAGAAFAGARAAVGTSGGGFALMNEAVSFCGVAEIGMVYYLVSRPGPATGLPTWTAQGDLLHAIYSGHGEFPKVVIAPGDIQEAFEFGIESVNLATKLQMPILVLSDKYIGESSTNTTDLFKEKPRIDKVKVLEMSKDEYKRYSLKTKTGVSLVSVPGTQHGEYLSNSYEHDEYGFSTEDAQVVEAMTQKRFKKLEYAQTIAPKPLLFGNKKAKKLIIGWGSTKGPILEALKSLSNKEEYAFLQIRTLWPINPDIKYIIDGFKEVMVFENNQTSQLTTLLKSQFNFNPSKVVTKNNGRPFFPEEIYDELN